MKILRFSRDGVKKYGVLNSLGEVREISGDIYEPFEFTGNIYNLEEINLLAPCEPSKVICVGLNYTAHINEFARINNGIPVEPVIFLKPPTAVIGPQEDIVYPEMSRRVDYEAELVVVIGKAGKNINKAEVPKYILGYTCGNDVSARDLQKIDRQWTRAKSFDTFAPLGPWIETELDPQNLKVQSFLNDELKQESSTANMIFPVFELVSFISRVMTLKPGDVIFTGTPEGVGPMAKGDIVKVVVEGIGGLQNKLV